MNTGAAAFIAAGLIIGGRPSTGLGPNVGLRLLADLAEKLEAWIAKQSQPRPSRPEAIGRPLAKGLSEA